MDHRPNIKERPLHIPPRSLSPLLSEQAPSSVLLLPSPECRIPLLAAGPPDERRPPAAGNCSAL